MFNKKRLVAIVAFLLLSFLVVTFGSGRGAYSVEFFDGYDDSLISKQSVNHGEDAKVPEDPYHENYIFGGWYLYGSENTRIIDFTNIIKSLKVEARYGNDVNNNGVDDENDEYFNVEFVDGYTSRTISKQRVLTGMPAVAPAVNAYDGFTFMGWDRSFSNIISDLTVTSIYRSNPVENVVYTLNFYDRDENLISTQRVEQGAAGTTVENVPVYEGYHLDGWFTSKDGNGTEYIVGDIVNNSASYYGYWVIDKHNVIINSNGGDLETGSDLTLGDNNFDYGTEIILPTATKNYKLTYEVKKDEKEKLGQDSKTVTVPAVLKGWCLNEKTCDTYYQPGDKVVVKEDAVFNAVWSTSLKDINITSATKEQTDAYNYNFLGWSNINREDVLYKANDKVYLSEDITIYSLFNAVLRTYDVETDEDGGLVDDEDKIEEKQEYGNKFNLPEATKSYKLTYVMGENERIIDSINPVKVNATLDGWKETKENKLYAVGTEFTVEKDLSFKAIWSASKTKTVISDANKRETDKYTYELSGWATEIGGQKVYSASEEIYLDKDLTLYPIFESTIRSYDLIINYVYDNLSTAAPQYRQAYKYDSNYDVESPEVIGYHPAVNNLKGTMKNGLQATIKYYPNTDTAYKVEHYYENASGVYVLDESKTDNNTGTTKETATAVAKPVENLYVENTAHSDRVASAEIKADESTVLKLYYSRLSYTLTFDSKGGTDVTPVTQKWGTEVEKVTSPTKKGYVFNGWDPALPETMPSEDKTLVAQWNAADNSYIVNHYKQNITNDRYTLDETEMISAKTDSETNARANNYDGFTALEFSQSTVKYDGSTIIDIYYDRNVYELSFVPEGGKFSDGTIETKTSNLRYGATISVPTISKVGYVFNGWGSQVAQTMPSNDLTYTAQWNAATNTAYIVEHYYENASGVYVLDESKTDNNTGTTKETATAVAKPIENLYVENTAHSDRVASAEIKADGSTVLKLYYSRLSYTLTFDSNGGTDVTPVTQKWGTTVGEVTSPTKKGYVFNGWNPALPETMPSEDKTLVAQWNAATNTPYTVEHYYENEDGRYVLDESKTDNNTGTTEETATAVAKPIENLYVENTTHSDRVASAEIKADGSTVLKLYYSRLSYTLTFDSNGGSVVTPITQKWGTEVEEVTSPTKQGYVFNGWNPALPETMPSEDKTLVAQWNAATNTAYTVEHYYENASGVYVLDESKTDNNTGTTKETATAVAKPIENLYVENTTHSDRVASAEIKADGSTVLKLYYSRLSYTLTFDSDGGTDVTPVTQKWGTEVEEVTSPTKQGYVFNGWNPALPETMPSENKTLVAVWNAATNTPYTVNHYKQNANDNNYTLAETDDKTGTTLQQTQAEAKSYTGFVAKEFTQETISASGDTVVNIYYDRNVYELSFIPNGGKFSDDTTETKTTSLRYGATIVAPAITRNGYTLINWNPALYTTMPNNDVSFEAMWSANTVNYVVNHYKQNADNSDYALDAPSDVLSGKTGETTLAVARSFDYFSVKSFEQTTITVDDAGEGNAVVNIYYDRSTYTLKFVPNNGQNTIEDTKKYEETITAPTIGEKIGYTFDKWIDASGNGVVDKMPNNDLEYFAQWNANIVDYVVKHYKETLTDDEYENDAFKEDTLSGHVDTLTQAVSKENVTGFTAQTINQVNITVNEAGEGNAIVNAYYSRNAHNLIFNANGGTFDESVTPNTVVKYEDSIVRPIDPTKDGYIFAGWLDASNNGLLTTMPDNDLTYTAQWTPRSDLSYTTEYYLQNIDGTYGVEASETVVTDNATMDATVYANQKLIEGFTFDSSANNTISGTVTHDNSLVLKLYYKRNSYQVTLVASDYIANVSFNDGTNNVTKNFKYGQDVVINATTVDNNVDFTYNFGSWTEANNIILTGDLSLANSSIKMPSKNITLTAKATRSEILPNITVGDLIITNYPDANGNTVEPGNSVSYSMEITNNEENARNIKLGVTSNGNNTGTYTVTFENGNKVTYTLGNTISIPAGEKIVITFNKTVKDSHAINTSMTTSVNVTSVYDTSISTKVSNILVEKTVQVKAENAKNKNVILILDLSRSMNWKLNSDEDPSYGQESRLSVLKESANEFIDNLYNDANSNNTMLNLTILGIGALNYSQGYDNSGMYDEMYDDVYAFKIGSYDLNGWVPNDKIDNLEAVGGTNIEGSLRLVQKIIENKILSYRPRLSYRQKYGIKYTTDNSEDFVVLLTDGVNGINNTDYADPLDKDEEEEVNFVRNNTNVLAIGFGKDASKIGTAAHNDLFTITQDENKIFNASSESDLDLAFDAIASIIGGQQSVSGIITATLPENGLYYPIKFTEKVNGEDVELFTITSIEELQNRTDITVKGNTLYWNLSGSIYSNKSGLKVELADSSIATDGSGE